MHVLPRAAELQRRFPGELVVIGVHSGKFVEERRTENVRHACARLGVRHPVVNDRHFRIWRSYAVNAWPTVVLVSPDGYVAGVQAGEFDVDAMAAAIDGLAERYRREGLLKPGPPGFGPDPAAPPEPSGELRYPTRAVARGDRLFVSDAGHHRVLELRIEAPSQASVVRAFGDGARGFRDGPASEARFGEPQGLAAGDGVLFVADRRNHAIRLISLADGGVTTIAGTGELGGYPVPEGPGRKSALRSPWGLALSDRTLLVAMAGSHQIFGIDLAREHPLSLVAGSGAEDITDGAARGATLAQTSGLATSADLLFFADSESSSVRRVSLTAPMAVETIVGTGLFDFGDRDGAGDKVLLQHDLDLALIGERLLIADTYNSRLKLLDPSTRECNALPGEAGSGEALYEPGGVWAGPEGAFVADTNNHRVLRVDPLSGTLTPIEVTAPARSSA